uniref:C-type lectin domain-containing protein n=1 Tax=Sinocyclocheilus rhinocerous TaxID=307959 RepID=A0A673L4P4_9TELE
MLKIISCHISLPTVSFLEIFCSLFDWLNAPVLFALSVKVCCDWSHHHTHLSLKETWEGALEYSRTHYNNLASLSTADKMNSALLEITQAETVYVWTGLHYLAGDWLWVTGDDLDYTAWYQNEQPQCPARDLRCGALDKQTNLWTHRNCEEKLSFFCL